MTNALILFTPSVAFSSGVSIGVDIVKLLLNVALNLRCLRGLLFVSPESFFWVVVGAA